MKLAPSSTQDPSAPVPIGTWIKIEPKGLPSVIAFTYLDHEAGFSAHGFNLTEDGSIEEQKRTVIRQPASMPWRLLEPEEILRYKLDPKLPWVAEHYGPQPPAGTLWGTWRQHPKLKGRFHASCLDDLQVLAHDGGKHSTRNAPEVIWVRMVAMDGDRFRGVALNQPHKLQSVRQSNEIQFLAVQGSEFPILVTPRYLAERPSWTIQPCDKCGLSEMFDAPSDYFQAAFPGVPAEGASIFTAFCPLCGGVQGVEKKELPDRSAPPQPGRSKPWWKFWD